MVISSAAKAYANIGLESGVQAVSPAKLILMLYDGAIAAIRDANAHMAAGRIAAKGTAVSKAIHIIDAGLAPAVDAARGGEIAAQLHRLYDYMCRRLALANLRNDPAGLEQVSALLRDLREAWAEIAEKPVLEAQEAAAAPARPVDAQAAASSAPAPAPVPAAEAPTQAPAFKTRMQAAYTATP